MEKLINMNNGELHEAEEVVIERKKGKLCKKKYIYEKKIELTV